MERQVSQGCPRRLIGLLAGLLAVGLVVSPTVLAGSAAMGVILESTQLANEAQLVTSNVKQAEMVMHELQSVRYMKQNLEQLAPGLVNALTGPAVTRLQKLNSLDNQLMQYTDVGSRAANILQKAAASSRAQHISPHEYLQQRITLANSRGGAYKKSYEANVATLKNMNAKAAQLQATASSIPHVTSQVQGLQQLLAQNAQMQSLLISLNQSIARQNALAALHGQAASAASAASLGDHPGSVNVGLEANGEALKKINPVMPNPRDMPPLGAASSVGRSH